MSNPSRTLDSGLWLVLALMWSSSFAVIKLGLDTVDPMVLVAGRMTIGAVTMLGVMLIMGQRLSWLGRAWVDYAVTGLLGSTFPFLLITFAEMSVDSALAAILMGCAPVATILLANAVLPDEPLTHRVLVSAGCAFVGVAILVGPEALNGLGADVLGQLAVVGATFCYAASTIYIRMAVRRPALEMAAGSMTVGAVFVTIAALLAGQSFAVPATATAAGAIIYLGLVSTASANLIYFYLVPRLGATKMSQINFAIPVGGTLIGVILLDESLDLQRMIALCVISGAVLLILSGQRVARRQTRAT